MPIVCWMAAVAGATSPAGSWIVTDVGDGADDLLVGDFDGDTCDDLLVRDHSGVSSSVYAGGPTGLAVQPSRVHALRPQDAESLVADLNGDTFDDVVLVRELEIAVYYGSSFGLLDQWPHVFPTVRALREVAGGDLDGDGYDDLVLTLYDSVSGLHIVYWWRGGSNGLAIVPSWSRSGGVGFGRGDVAVLDADGDGFDDLALGGGAVNTGTLTIYRGSPAGPVDPPWAVVNTPALHDAFGEHLLAAGDLNGDGHEDLVAPAYDTTLGIVSFAFVAGAPAGLAAPVLTPAVGVDWPVLASYPDADGDGDDELLVGLAYFDTPTQTDCGVAAVVELNPGGQFDLPVPGTFALGTSAGDHAGASVRAGDFDCTGLPDVAISAEGTGPDGRIDVFYDFP